MCGDICHSEDITQEVFYNIMRYRTSYNEGNFLSWLFTIARNCMNRHMKSRMEHEEIEALGDVPIFEREEKDYTRLHMALNCLQPQDKEVLVLSRYQGIKYAEVAEIIGSTEGAVKSKVNRALQKLRKIYFQN